jgi:transcriptional regulator of acetoin/glycerol metabolism
VSQPRESKPEGSRRGGRPEEEPLRPEAEVREALEAKGWNATEAAKVLGISRGAMVRLMEKLGLKRPER